MEAENEAHALIKALTVDFEKDYKEEKLPKEVAVWLGILEMPRRLVKTGDSRIDLIVSTLFDLARSMDEGFGAFVAMNDEVEELLKARDRCVKQKSEREEAVIKAREKVVVQTHYQCIIQDRAARAIQEPRGPHEALDDSTWQWQALIGLAANALIRAGTKYSKAFSDVKFFEKKLSSLNKKLKKVMAAKEAKRPLVVVIVDRWQSTIAEVGTIMRTIHEVKDQWRSNEKVEEAFQKLEAILRIKKETQSRQEHVNRQNLAEKQLDLPGADLIR